MGRCWGAALVTVQTLLCMPVAQYHPVHGARKNSLPHPSCPYRWWQPLIPSQVTGSADRGTLRELTSLNYIRSHRLGDTSEQNDKAVWEPAGPSAPGVGLEDFVSEDAQSLPLFFFFFLKNTRQASIRETHATQAHCAAPLICKVKRRFRLLTVLALASQSP